MRKLIVFALVSILLGVSNGYAKEDCLSISKKPVKVEAWVSKKYEKDYRNIRREFQEMGNTKVGLFFYPAENPSRVVAIGRCVPAYMAQHFLKKAWKYSLGTTHLVHQGFVSSHWAGIGTSLFSENSMNSSETKFSGDGDNIQSEYVSCEKLLESYLEKTNSDYVRDT